MGTLGLEKPGESDYILCRKRVCLVEPSESWDVTYAHKPWLIKHDGTVYHFYCAVGDQGRVIALATSKDLRK